MYFISGTLVKDAWLMDSGYSHYMTGLQDVFISNSEEYSDLHVYLGNDSKCLVEGIGDIQFQ